MSDVVNKEIMIVDENSIKDKIYLIRGQKVMLDFDLAEIYGYETKRFNEQVKNNKVLLLLDCSDTMVNYTDGSKKMIDQVSKMISMMSDSEKNNLNIYLFDKTYKKVDLNEFYTKGGINYINEKRSEVNNNMGLTYDYYIEILNDIIKDEEFNKMIVITDLFLYSESNLNLSSKTFSMQFYGIKSLSNTTHNEMTYWYETIKNKLSPYLPNVMWDSFIIIE